MPPRPPRKKTTKRPPKKKPGKKGALIHFTTTRKGTARPHGENGDGSVWVLIGPISWIQYKNKGISTKTKRAALKALKKFKKKG